MRELGILNPYLFELLRIAEALECTGHEVVFLGGSVAPLLVTDAAARTVRPTDDIDVIVEVVSRREYAELEAELRECGFQHDTSEEAPVCRWLFDSVRVDIMPIDPHLLGFSNRWYPYALRTASPYFLSRESGYSIPLISPVAFLATKIEAFRSPHRRFGGDFRASHDLEDVLAVMDGRPEIDEEIAAAEPEVQTYLAEAFRAFLDTPAFLDALPGHLEPGPANATRSRMLIKRLHALSAL